MEKALQALEQAKARVANEKKKQNEKKRKAENHHKYIMGGTSQPKTAESREKKTMELTQEPCPNRRQK